MADRDSFYRLAEQRIEWLTLSLGGAGAVFAAVRWGWRPAAGVAVGTVLTWLNFRWLKQGVNALVELSTAQAGADHPRVPGTVYLKFFGRYALLLLVVYVILLRSLVPLPAILGGLFAVVAAVMIEVLFELVRGKLEIETHS
jgi:hypothetical protein